MNNFTPPLTNPVLQANNGYQYNINPTTKLTIEQQNLLQQYHNPNQIQQQSNPYEDYIGVLASCSELVKQKIFQNEDYQRIDAECEILIKQLLYAEIIPKVLAYPQGRIAFEKLCNVTKQLKQDFTQEEVSMTQNMQILMSDPVVMARLQELQNFQRNSQPNPIKQNTQTPQQAEINNQNNKSEGNDVV